jgi:hypothetical protein
MPFHALLEFRKPPWLAHPKQRIHLILQHTQVRQDLPFKLRHLFISSAASHELTGKSVNTALENREYTGGVDPSYIRT